MPWDELSKLNDQEVEGFFHPDSVTPDPPERPKELYAFFPYAEKRLKQPGMTLQILWKEYSLKHLDGFQSTGF